MLFRSTVKTAAGKAITESTATGHDGRSVVRHGLHDHVKSDECGTERYDKYKDPVGFLDICGYLRRPGRHDFAYQPHQERQEQELDSDVHQRPEVPHEIIPEEAQDEKAQGEEPPDGDEDELNLDAEDRL